jgi:hypothetical protein
MVGEKGDVHKDIKQTFQDTPQKHIASPMRVVARVVAGWMIYVHLAVYG